jgi:hypothetical protein
MRDQRSVRGVAHFVHVVQARAGHNFLLRGQVAKQA